MYLGITMYIHPYLTVISERRSINVKDSKEEYMASFGRRKGKRELICNYNLKDKGNNKIFSERRMFMT